ncbi:unnamed protein product [Blepharisma stoltei]|uniref:Protein kinase domain-containing protein n=1 Tax=Blepharisma stoltei TaxID=1481888 RepID=A0AAU9JV74_9CILI|nr:unnamed protein product [Blepharisma stoltei]
MFRESDIKSRKEEHKFWSLCFSTTNDAIYSGKLFESSSSGALKESWFHLTSHYLVKNKSNINGLSKRSLLIWKPVRPFVKNCHLYGFRIGYYDCYKEFYAESKEVFAEWLKFLSCIGIMQNIEEDFHFLKEIGKGNIGTIFLAEEINTHTKYTVKYIKSNKFDEYIINEINILRTLNHPNAVKLYKVYESDAGIYIVLDNLSETNLFQKIVDVKNFSEKDCLVFAKKIMEFLDYFNSLNIIHRDIKLENFAMSSNAGNTDFKLIDFSMATFDIITIILDVDRLAILHLRY